METLQQEEKPQEELDEKEFDSLADELLRALENATDPKVRKNFVSVALMRQRLVGKLEGQNLIMKRFDELVDQKMNELLAKRGMV